MRTTEIDVETGETTERPLTPEEERQKQADAAAHIAAEQAEQDARVARAKADQDWRAALEAADTVAKLKAVLLGTNLPAQAASRVR